MKIENKISRILEIALLAIAVVVSVVFFVGGTEVNAGLLLNTTFIFVGLIVATTFIFAIAKFVENLMHDSKRTLKSLLGPLGLIALVFVTYLFADATPLVLPGYTGGSNVAGWLKVADVCLYTTYAMTVLTIMSWIVTATVKALR